MKKRILFVDDQVGTLAPVLRAVMPEYEFRFESDSYRTFAVAQEFRPDVFLLDLSMPGLGGLEVADALKRHSTFSQTLVIFVSGKVEPSRDDLPSLVAGRPAFAKPIDFRKLKSFLQVQLALTQTPEELRPGL